MNPSKTSAKIVKTPVPVGTPSARYWYLANYKDVPGPWISYSAFVPPSMVKHLMRHKKDSAIAVKFQKNKAHPDKITNMEGAMHTFVNPFADITVHGDYEWQGHHSIREFGTHEGRQLGRQVLLSALIQQDFENEEVMLKVARLEDFEFLGLPTMPEMLSVSEKQDDQKRRKYDWDLRRYIVYHLVASHRLPTRAAVRDTAMTVHQTLDFLADAITNQPAATLAAHMQGRAIRHKTYYVSLEVLFMTALHQVRNEVYELEDLCARQGYVYTFNPPAIFARFFDGAGTELLSRVHVAALKLFARVAKLDACRCFVWNDFSSKTIFKLVQDALKERPHIKVRRWTDVFVPTAKLGLYVPPAGCENSILVIHNNSDAFGQNIQTEPSGGSLDGVIGAYSSASASLLRTRGDLCDRLLKIPL